jgi:hypothetical protein
VTGSTANDLHHILRIRWDVRFTQAAWHLDRGPAFQEYRWRLFTTYTLPCLQRQRAHWQVWLWGDPELAGLHAELSPQDARVRFVYDLDREAQSVAAHDPQRLFVVGRIDSDDMLAPDTLELVAHSAQRADASRPVLQLFSGCAYDERRNRVLPWRNPSPAFVFRPITGADLREGMPSFGGRHSSVHARSVHVRTPEPAFCVVLHGRNLSNSPHAAYATGRVPPAIDRGIRARFGLPDRPTWLHRLAPRWSARFKSA